MPELNPRHAITELARVVSMKEGLDLTRKLFLKHSDIEAMHVVDYGLDHVEIREDMTDAEAAALAEALIYDYRIAIERNVLYVD